MQQKLNKKISNKHGFTLVETLISILIFSSSVVVIISVTSKGLSDVIQVKNKLAATYLAEEGIETIRSFRDKEVASLGTQGWMQFMTDISSCTTVNNGCTITLLPNPQIVQCTGGVSDPCKVGTLSDTGLYVPSNWMFVTDPTPYYRKITVDQEGTVGEVKVISEVVWTQGLATGSVKLEEYLYNW